MRVLMDLADDGSGVGTRISRDGRVSDQIGVNWVARV